MKHLHLMLCAVAALTTTTHARADKPVRFLEAADIAQGLNNTTDQPTDYAILDLRTFGDYLEGHIPGAVHLDDECLRAPLQGMPVQYCHPTHLAQTFGGAGVSLDSPVLVYASQDDPLSATMAAYALTRIGHNQITILNGGYASWAANHPTTRAFPTIEPVDITPTSPTLNAIELEEFRDTIGYDEYTFLDARPAPQYRGDHNIWIRNGHIPAAHSLHWRNLTEPDNPARLKPASEIKAALEELSISPYDDIVVYCGTGREATMLMLALTCHIEHQGVRLFEGSWTQYSATQGLPIEVGPRQDPKLRVFRDEDILFSGQPTVADLRELADQGVRTVIACRTNTEMERLDFDQASALEALGINYLQIPMGGHDGYNNNQVRMFAKAYEDAARQGTVLVHCASGSRARSLWMAYLIAEQGLSPRQAMDRGKALGERGWSLEMLVGEPIVKDQPLE